eukprot:GHVR01149428.1.p2 GENE.GHVR01149428.1~~GHVR01149428.1.p2  ORF type:complete len:114 (-),score=24.06 GHVR01149428.1:171-512(-)
MSVIICRLGRSAEAKEPPVRLRLSGERHARMDTDRGAERYAAEAPCGGANGRMWARAARGKPRCWPSARRPAAACARAAASVRNSKAFAAARGACVYAGCAGFAASCSPRWTD